MTWHHLPLPHWLAYLFPFAALAAVAVVLCAAGLAGALWRVWRPGPAWLGEWDDDEYRWLRVLHGVNGGITEENGA